MKSTYESPATRNRPMCDTSNSPATLRTAKCSSRMDVYCCGMSHPPKSTMRPPSATCRSYSGVRRGSLAVKRVVDVDGVGVDELQELLVVAAPRIGHDLRDVARPVNCPLELLRDLRRGRLVTQVAAKQHLGPFVVVGRGDQELGVTHRGRFGGDRGLHLLANPVLRKLGKVSLVARRESMHCFEQAQRAFLDQVEHGKPPVFAGLGEADDESEVGGHEAFLAGAVAERRLLEQVGPLGLSQRWRHPGLLAQLAQERVIAIRMDGFGSHRSILRPACGASRRPMFHVLHRHAARWVAILGACARGLRSGWSGCFLPSRPPSCRSRPRHPPRMSSRSTSMDEIVTNLLNSTVPVIVYVYPSGARAASAGLFVAQAADIVAMAPGTNIGSAHPIQATGENLTGDLGAKVLNDAVTRVRSLAQMHGRNADWAEDAVRNSVNIDAEQAVRLHVADLLAADIPSLLNQVDGRQVARTSGTLTIHTAGAIVDDFPMPIWQVFLNALIDPTIAALLIIVAGYGIITEMGNPGLILPGVIGGIAAVLAIVSLANLPLNVAGVLLMLLALILFIADLIAPT